MIKLKFDHPHFEKGTVVGAGGGLVALVNGEDVEVDSEAEELFVLTHGQSVQDYFASDPHVTVSGEGDRTVTLPSAGTTTSDEKDEGGED